MRELHFDFTNGAIFFALGALALWLSYKRLELADWLGNDWTRIWLGGAFFTYLIADLFDRHLFRFLPGYDNWHDLAEETLETLGHAQLFALTLVALKFGLERSHNGGAAPGGTMST